MGTSPVDILLLGHSLIVTIYLFMCSLYLLFLYVNYFLYLPVTIYYQYYPVTSLCFCEIWAWARRVCVSLYSVISGFLIFSETSFASRFLEFPSAVLNYIFVAETDLYLLFRIAILRCVLSYQKLTLYDGLMPSSSLGSLPVNARCRRSWDIS